jgi:hypothetical protein
MVFSRAKVCRFRQPSSPHLSVNISQDIFVGLNVLRALSIIALLLLFASSIVTLVHDIRGVNHFAAEGKSNTHNSTSNDAFANCNYIE